MIATLRQRNFALLWFGGLISMAGDWILFVALPLHVYQLTGSTLATSGMFIAAMLPSLLLGSVAGVFVDRWDRRRTMIAADLLLALSLVPLLLVRDASLVWVVYVVAFVESCLAQFFRPAEGALLPRLVDERDLVSANSLNSLNNNLARLIGPPIGGAVAAAWGLAGVALVDAATFLVAGLLIALIRVEPGVARAERAERPGAETNPWVAVWREWVAGLAMVKRIRAVLVVFLYTAITSVGEGVFSVLIVVWVNRILGGGARELGLLMAAQAVGGLAGGLLVSHFSRISSPARLIGLGSIVFGLGDLVLVNYPSFFPGIGLALVCMVVVGVPGVAVWSGLQTLVQTHVPDEYLGRVFGAWGTTSALLALLGTALAGGLGDFLGVVPVLNVQGSGYIAAGLMVLLLLGKATASHRPSAAATDPLR